MVKKAVKIAIQHYILNQPWVNLKDPVLKISTLPLLLGTELYGKDQFEGIFTEGLISFHLHIHTQN